MKVVRPRSSLGLKCGSFRSGDSILRPERSEADRRMGVYGDFPSPEMGLGLLTQHRFGLADSMVEW
jgi:hypothetical protein